MPTFTDLRRATAKPTPAQIAQAFRDEIDFLDREFQLSDPLNMAFSSAKVAGNLTLQVAAECYRAAFLSDLADVLNRLERLGYDERMAMSLGEPGVEELRETAEALHEFAAEIDRLAEQYNVEAA